MIDRERFGAILSMLARCFGTEVDRALLDAYWIALDGMSDGDFELAAKRSMEELRFMPKPVELRELAGFIPVSARATLAWAHAMEALSSIGPYESVDLGDPVAHAAVRAVGGWVWLGSQTTDHLERFVSGRFVKAYVAVSRMDQPDDGHLVGMLEMSNTLSGYEVAAPVSKVAGYLAPKRPANTAGLIEAGS
jgi:hypothetical protein